jgi:hypothetical protein
VSYRLSSHLLDSGQVCTSICLAPDISSLAYILLSVLTKFATRIEVNKCELQNGLLSCDVGVLQSVLSWTGPSYILIHKSVKFI